MKVKKSVTIDIEVWEEVVRRAEAEGQKESYFVNERLKESLGFLYAGDDMGASTSEAVGPSDAPVLGLDNGPDVPPGTEQ
jgi:hypothetical protein